MATTAEAASSVTLSVTASGESRCYQWQTYLPPAGWQEIPRATGSSYTATCNDISDGRTFSVVVKKAAGKVYSDAGVKGEWHWVSSGVPGKWRMISIG